MTVYNKFKIVADPCQLLGEASCIDASSLADRFHAPALPAPWEEAHPKLCPSPSFDFLF